MAAAPYETKHNKEENDANLWTWEQMKRGHFSSSSFGVSSSCHTHHLHTSHRLRHRHRHHRLAGLHNPKTEG